MKRIALFLILISVISNGMAQSLRIVDEVSQQPIEYVFAYTASGLVSATSDGKGIINLSVFQLGDSILLQHPSYLPFTWYYSLQLATEVKVSLVERMIKLEEFVFSVTGSSQEADEVPNRVAVVSSKDIAFNNPQTSADALTLSGEVFVQKSQLGGGSPMIRGFSANRILLNVNGVRMNNAIYRSGNLQNVIALDANSVDQMEVVFGPGSVLYGSDAIGGVVNVITISPALTDTRSFEVSGKALLRYSSAANEKTGHVDFSISNDKFGFLTSVTYADYNDLRMGNVGHPDYTRPQYTQRINNEDVMVANPNPNIQRFSGFSQVNFMQKILFQPSKHWQIDLDFQYAALSDVPRYDRLIEYDGDTLKYADWYYGPQKWLMGGIGLRYFGKHKLLDEMKLKFSNQNTEESRNTRRFNDPQLITRQEQVGLLIFNADFNKRIQPHHRIFYGLNIDFNHVGSVGQQLDIESNQVSPDASRYPDGSTLNGYAGYLNYEYTWNDTFIYQAGVRYSQYHLAAEMDTTFYKFPFQDIILNNGAMSGGFGFIFKPKTGLTFNTNLSAGFRAPNIDDVAKVFDSEPGNVVVPNPNLKPEYAYNVDLGIDKIFNEHIEVDFSAFFTYLDQAMVRRDFSYNGQDSIFYDGELSKTQAVVNASSAVIYGFYFNINANITKNLDLSSRINYIRGHDDEQLPLRHVAPLYGNTHLVYHSKKVRVDLSADYNGTISNKNLAPTEQAKTQIYAKDANGNPYAPGWVTANIMASYQFNRIIGINLGLENIFNVRYRPYSSGIVAPGRNFMVALRFNF